MQGRENIVRVLSVEKRRRFFGEKSEAPNLQSHELAFKLASAASQDGGVRQIEKDKLLSVMLNNQDDRIVAVSTSPFNIELVFPKSLIDKDGFKYDLGIRGHLSIQECRAFLENLANKILLSSGLVSGDLEAYLVTLISQQVREEIRAHKAALDSDLDNAIPISHWNNRIFSWFAEKQAGLAGTITSIAWSSEDKRQADIEKANTEMIANRQKNEKLRLQAQAEINKLQAEHEKQMREIEYDKDMNETAKRLKKDQIVKSAQLEIKNVEKQINSIDREEELERARVQLEIAKIMKDTEQIEKAELEAEENRKKEDAIQDKFAQALEEFTRFLKEKSSVLPDPTNKDQNADYKLTGQVNIATKPYVFDFIGFKNRIWMSIEFFRGKSGVDEKVKLIKTQSKFRERTVKATKEEVKTLSEGESLAFRISVKRSGFMTLLNIGTSGEIFIHVPSALLKGGKGYVKSGEEYDIPGPELFPWKYWYIEGGPAGWEHMVAFVSDSPLIEESTLMRSSEDEPLVKLTREEYETLFKKLAEELPSDAWSVCIESFLVVDKSSSLFLD